MAANRSNTFFMTANYLKNNTMIDGNVDDELLNPIILNTQRKYIEPILGTTLYTKLVDLIGAGSVTGIYQTILNEYVLPALKERTLAEALPFINFKLTNKNVAVNSSDNSSAASKDDMIFLIENVKNTAEFFEQRLMEYLKEEIQNIPEYQNPDTNIDDIYPRKSARYFGGMYLGNGSGSADDCWPGTSNNEGFGEGIPIRD